MKRIIIFGNKYREEVIRHTKVLADAFRQRGVEIGIEKDFCQFLVEKGCDLSYPHTVIDEDCGNADMAFSIGGDGTFIRAAAKIGKSGIPLLGINAGRLGFLADVSGDEIGNAVEEIMDGKYKIEERSLLRLHTEDRLYTDFNYALNEIAVLKRDSSAMITIHVWANGVFVNSYQADGLLVATSTGSTAYSMSVGGPIVVPQASNFILTPVAPHSINVRPIIIPDTWDIELKVESRNKHFLIALDGRNNIFDDKTTLSIRKADFTIKTVKREDQDFFCTLRTKLRWGNDERER
ncbi:MAG: NAD kinase [Paludibacteraceae bacterium]|nr:NAD kinase [Paludibacteraceae bacterium]